MTPTHAVVRLGPMGRTFNAVIFAGTETECELAARFQPDLHDYTVEIVSIERDEP